MAKSVKRKANWEKKYPLGGWESFWGGKSVSLGGQSGQLRQDSVEKSEVGKEAIGDKNWTTGS